MKTNEFDYTLPAELIANTAATPRDSSRLLVLGRENGTVSHRHFFNLPDFLIPGDVLVLNNSKVLPARLLGNRPGKRDICEILLLCDKGQNVWECLVKPGKKMKHGSIVEFGGGELVATVCEVRESGSRLVEFSPKNGDLMGCFYRFGKMPLPPYIKNSKSDDDRYQTVYAKSLGSAAAPTAGLHFTQELLDKIEKMGVIIAEVTLHVGIGTFRSVETDTIEEHKMHSEHFEVNETSADIINLAMREGRRIIAVGTTSARTLEGMFLQMGSIKSAVSQTDIYIIPGFKFFVIDGLVTNFHLPKSTLLMLVSAFAEKKAIDNAYKIAIQERYRFYSFGDAMLII